MRGTLTIPQHSELRKVLASEHWWNIGRREDVYIDKVLQGGLSPSLPCGSQSEMAGSHHRRVHIW